MNVAKKWKKNYLDRDMLKVAEEDVDLVEK